MTTILVTGSNGLLGQKIIYGLLKKTNVKCISTSRGENRMREKQGYEYISLDITDHNSVSETVRRYKPDVIINTAALTNVDACEDRRNEAFAMNVAAVENLATVSLANNCHLIQLSTDFVFNGLNGPYIETDNPDPLSYYAQTKYEAEKIIMRLMSSWCIIRTIIIYGVVDDNSRSNVVLWAFNALKNKKSINVINDQFRSPTLAEDLADACISAALKKATGIFHVSGRELMNILDIVKITASFFNLDQSYIQPVSSVSLNQAAKRPPVTGFIISKAMKELDFNPKTFHEGLVQIKNQLKMVGGL
jgi:dTDP-4-dehydrorhamnose reductase